MPNIKSVSFTDPATVDLERIRRQQMLAMQLQQQSEEPLPTGQMAGGYFVPTSPLSHLAKALKGAQARRTLTESDQELKGLGERQASERQTTLSRALRMMQGEKGGIEEDAAGNVNQVPAMQADPRGAMQVLAASRDPMLQQAGLHRMLAQIPIPKQPEPFTLAPGAVRYDPQGRQVASAPQKAPQQAPSNLDRLLRERASLPPNDPRIAIYENAIRKESETAKQIVPTIQMPRQEQIIQTAEGPMRLVGGQAVPIIGQSGQPVRAPSGRAGPMSATAQRELIETEEQLQGGQQALSFLSQAKDVNDKAMGFSGAGALASAGSLLPQYVRPSTVDATMELTNIIQNVALPQLKSIFGGMPTEGERKILLEMQGSASQPPNVRKGIFERAEKAVQARLKFSAEKAKRLREGTYFTGEGLPSINPASGTGQSVLDQADAIIGNR